MKKKCIESLKRKALYTIKFSHFVGILMDRELLKGMPHFIYTIPIYKENFILALSSQKLIFEYPIKVYYSED